MLFYLIIFDNTLIYSLPFLYILGSTHPVERIEFAIDSIGPASSSHMLTADLLCVIIDVMCQIKGVSSKKWGLRIGHRGLILAAALYHGLLDDVTHDKILSVLYNITTSNSNFSLRLCCYVYFSR